MELNDEVWPDCSEPDYIKWPNNICAMLQDIKRFRFRMSDPAGYRAHMLEVERKSSEKKIKGSKEGGKKE